MQPTFTQEIKMTRKYRCTRLKHELYLFTVLALLAIASTVFIAGCGGGGGGGTGGGGSSTPPGNLSALETQLNTLIYQSQTSVPTTGQVQPVATGWQTAYAASPNNPDVALGYAISEAALDGLTFSNEYNVAIPSVAAKSSAKLRASVTSQSSRLASLGNLLICYRRARCPH